MSPVKSAVTPIYGTAFVDPVAAMVSSPIPTVPIVSMEPVVAVPAISIVAASEIRAMVLITAAVISCRGVRRRARRNPDPHQHANCQDTACYLRYQSVASHVIPSIFRPSLATPLVYTKAVPITSPFRRRNKVPETMDLQASARCSPLTLLVQVAFRLPK